LIYISALLDALSSDDLHMIKSILNTKQYPKDIMSIACIYGNLVIVEWIYCKLGNDNMEKYLCTAVLPQTWMMRSWSHPTYQRVSELTDPLLIIWLIWEWPIKQHSSPTKSRRQLWQSVITQVEKGGGQKSLPLPFQHLVRKVVAYRLIDSIDW